MINRENLTGIASWAGFCGIMFIIFGSLLSVCGGIMAIAGLFAFIVGSIPGLCYLGIGVLNILMGVRLRSIKSHIDLLLMQPEGLDTSISVNSIFYEMRGYLQMQGTLFIIALALIVIGLVIAMAVGFSTLTHLPYLLQ